MRIEKLDLLVQTAIPTVYQQGMSFYEVLNLVTNKVNEMIEDVNEYMSTDLTVYVNNLMTEWLNDGTFAALIANTVLDIGTRTYTEQNYVTDGQTLTESIDALDVSFTANFNSRSLNVKHLPEPMLSAKGDGTTDDTQAIKNAITYALENDYSVYIPNGDYVITDTITLGESTNIDRCEILGQHMRKTRLLFYPTMPGKPLFKFGKNSGYTILRNFEMTDVQTRQNIAIELYDDNLDSSPNWKNHFEFLHIYGFNKGITFNGNVDYVKDAHLDGTTFNKVAIWEYNIGMEFNNTQGVQTLGYDVDFINTYVGCENAIALVNNRGASWFFKGGSWTGKGTFVKFNVGQYNGCKFVIDSVRFELKVPYSKPIIAYSDYTEIAQRWAGQFIDFSMINCLGIGFNQEITLIKTPVVYRATFKNNFFIGGVYTADVYRTSETLLSSSSNRGSRGSLVFDGNTTIKINMIDEITKYLASGGYTPKVIVKNSGQNTSATNTFIDLDGFYYSRVNDLDFENANSISHTQRKIMGYRGLRGARLPSEIKLVLPPLAIPLNVIFPRTLGFPNTGGLAFYFVKDKVNWASGAFDIATDAIKIGEQTIDDNFGMGNIVVPIKSTNPQTFVGGGYTLKTHPFDSTSWLEGRFIIQFIDVSTGNPLSSGSQTPLEYCFVEYI